MRSEICDIPIEILLLASNKELFLLKIGHDTKIPGI